MIDKDKDIDYVLRTGLSPSWYCYVYNFLIDKDKEIERLNNVIDELEKSLVNEINNKYSSNEYKQTMNLVLLKLKELKGSDEE